MKIVFSFVTKISLFLKITTFSLYNSVEVYDERFMDSRMRHGARLHTSKSVFRQNYTELSEKFSYLFNSQGIILKYLVWNSYFEIFQWNVRDFLEWPFFFLFRRQNQLDTIVCLWMQAVKFRRVKNKKNKLIIWPF